MSSQIPVKCKTKIGTKHLQIFSVKLDRQKYTVKYIYKDIL